MANSKPEDQSTNHHQTRRRALLATLLGAGTPLSLRVLPDEWVTPVVDAIVIPSHAGTSLEDNPTGNYGSGSTGADATDSSLFDNIVERTEEEILDLFISAAEAGGCDANSSCDTAGTVDVAVVATINQNPSGGANQCVQARVTISGSSCASSCQFFDFMASVDGQMVTIADNCELSLHGMTLTDDKLSGSWSYSSGLLNRNGPFESPQDDGGGCGSLPGCM